MVQQLLKQTDRLTAAFVWHYICLKMTNLCGDMTV